MKKSKTHVTKPKSVSGKRTKQVADNGRSDEEENIDPSGGKQMILVKCIYRCSLPFPLDNHLQLVRQITLLLNRPPSLADQGLRDMASHCEALGCGKSSSILATEVKEINLFGVESSSFIPIEKE